VTQGLPVHPGVGQLTVEVQRKIEHTHEDISHGEVSDEDVSRVLQALRRRYGNHDQYVTYPAEQNNGHVHDNHEGGYLRPLEDVEGSGVVYGWFFVEAKRQRAEILS